LTVPAILGAFALWIVIVMVVPTFLPEISSLRENPGLHLQTQERTVNVTAPAKPEDVAAGRAKSAGEVVETTHKVAQKAMFFDKIIRIDPARPELGNQGVGRFYSENFILYHLGLPLDRLPPAAVVASRWFFDALFPFVCLIAISLVTPPSAPERAPAFYARLKTPVAPTPELDQEEIAKSNANPNRFDHEKLLPWSNWEFTRWKASDVAGFLGCWGIVGLILLLLFTVVHAGG
jgi:SSS family solute:Na+ symporter